MTFSSTLKMTAAEVVETSVINSLSQDDLPSPTCTDSSGFKPFTLEIIRIVKGRKPRYFGHIIRHESLQKDLLGGRVNGKRSRGRPRINCGDKIKNWRVRTVQDARKRHKIDRCGDNWWRVPSNTTSLLYDDDDVRTYS